MGLVDLGAEARLELLHPPPDAPQLVLEAQHVLDARKIEPELRGQLLNQGQARDVLVGVDAGATGSARRRDETLRLVGTQRLRVHPCQLGRDGDHVAGTVAHWLNTLSRGRSRRTLSYPESASFSAFVSFCGTVTLIRASRSPLPPPLSFGAPRPFTRRSFPFSVPAGTLRLTGPSGVGISIVAPRTASGYVMGTSRTRSASRRSYRGDRSTATTT